MVVAPAPASHAQMLWASIFARAGNLKSPAEAARVMNITSATASSIYNEVKSRGITGLANPAGLRPDPAPLRGRSFRKTEPREKIDMVALMKVVTRNMANETAHFAS